MTTPDLRRAGLDPAHILAICEHVAASGGHRPVGYVTAVPDGVRVRLRSPRAARAMRTALTRTGYDTVLTRPGRRWELLVTGWDDHALETRLAAMRTVIQQLSADPTATAAAVIDRYRQHVRPLPRITPGHRRAHPGQRGTARQRGRPLRHPRAPRSRGPASRHRQRAAAARHLGPGTSHR